ncbi:mitochondrial inner membrane protease subunit 1 isoform X2 [Fukomys damarensis]|uniref:mitochondrial inner membrane protease subunit 1 isoform X2 n=1 Tax=Fukomys damarensis TaxID=885580 RepID=UPI00053F41F4|nr:mitochondrial inner membrane protease subunit 1 isoform X2 [Fukomys damarensis]
MVAGRLPRRPACSVLCAPIAVTDPVRCFPAACRLQRVCAGHAAGRGGFSALAVLRKCDRKAPGTVLTPWITHVCFRFLSGSPAPTLNIEFIVEQTNVFWAINGAYHSKCRHCLCRKSQPAFPWHPKVPTGHVWLEGDNLQNSTDSRFYGPIPYGLIRGRIFFKIWPLSDFGFLRDSPNGHRFSDN